MKICVFRPLNHFREKSVCFKKEIWLVTGYIPEVASSTYWGIHIGGYAIDHVAFSKIFFHFTCTLHSKFTGETMEPGSPYLRKLWTTEQAINKQLSAALIQLSTVRLCNTLINEGTKRDKILFF